MKAYNQDTFYRVTVSEDEVREFMRQWPCSGLIPRSHSFTFQTSNGDLVDHNAEESEDGGALLALSDAAQEYGQKTLK